MDVVTDQKRHSKLERTKKDDICEMILSLFPLPPFGLSFILTPQISRD